MLERSMSFSEVECHLSSHAYRLCSLEASGAPLQGYDRPDGYVRNCLGVPTIGKHQGLVYGPGDRTNIYGNDL